MDILVVALFSYISGSIPFGLILTKIFSNLDIRKIGSGNIGATNVLRSGNKILASLTLTLDMFKGYIPVLITINYYPELIQLSCIMSFLGHLFPIWIKFKGGKGVATYLGILFCINFNLGIVFIISWLIIFFVSRYSSLGSILSSLIIPIFIFFNSNYEIEHFFIIMFVLILYTHKENVKRLINKEESKTKIY